MTEISADRFEQTLRSTLAGRATDPVPTCLHDAIAALGTDSTRQQRRFGLPSFGWPSLSSALTGVVGVAAVALLGVVVVFAYSGGGIGGPGAGARTYHWDTTIATLDADALTVTANGREFDVPEDAGLHSDPGGPSYRTLEMGWNANGTEMRLNMYFAADAQRWWVTEIRTYDGLTPGDWLQYDVPDVGAPRGQSFTGDLDLVGRRGNVSGSLSMKDVRLTAFAPGTGVRYDADCNRVTPPARPGQASRGLDAGVLLPMLNLQLGMDAVDADAQLNASNTCHEYRYLLTSIRYSQVWCVPPPGVIDDVTSGTDGQVILFVTASPNVLPLDFFLPVGCS
jgi:hypothetical protein